MEARVSVWLIRNAIRMPDGKRTHHPVQVAVTIPTPLPFGLLAPYSLKRGAWVL